MISKKKYKLNYETIRKYLEENERSQKWIGEKCGILPEIIWRCEKKDFDPSFETLARLIDFTGLDYKDLVIKR